jgi:hypothetical protein
VLQYLSPSGLRWLRAYIAILLIGATLAVAVARLAM